MDRSNVDVQTFAIYTFYVLDDTSVELIPIAALASVRLTMVAVFKTAWPTVARWAPHHQFPVIAFHNKVANSQCGGYKVAVRDESLR